MRKIFIIFIFLLISFICMDLKYDNLKKNTYIIKENHGLFSNFSNKLVSHLKLKKKKEDYKSINTYLKYKNKINRNYSDKIISKEENNFYISLYIGYYHLFLYFNFYNKLFLELYEKEIPDSLYEKYGNSYDTVLSFISFLNEFYSSKKNNNVSHYFLIYKSLKHLDYDYLMLSDGTDNACDLFTNDNQKGCYDFYKRVIFNRHLVENFNVLKNTYNNLRYYTDTKVIEKYFNINCYLRCSKKFFNDIVIYYIEIFYEVYKKSDNLDDNISYVLSGIDVSYNLLYDRCCLARFLDVSVNNLINRTSFLKYCFLKSYSDLNIDKRMGVDEFIFGKKSTDKFFKKIDLSFVPNNSEFSIKSKKQVFYYPIFCVREKNNFVPLVINFRAIFSFFDNTQNKEYTKIFDNFQFRLGKELFKEKFLFLFDKSQKIIQIIFKKKLDYNYTYSNDLYEAFNLISELNGFNLFPFSYSNLEKLGVLDNDSIDEFVLGEKK